MEQERRTVELKFEIRDPESFCIAVSDALGCRVVAEDTIHRDDGQFLEYYTVSAPAGAAIEFAREFDSVESARIVRETGAESLLEVVIDRQNSVMGALATSHAVIKRTVGESGTGVTVVEVPGHADASAVVDAMLDHHSGTSLRSKWHRDDADLVAVTGAVGTERYLSALTTKQRDAVRAAVQSGYLAWPRKSTASDCAAALGISQPTFSQHLYRGLELLLLDLFDISENERGRIPASH